MIHLEWGKEGVEQWSSKVDVCIIVDVLSFSTSVDAAVSAGAEVIPFPWRDQRAAMVASEMGAILAHQRQDAGTGPSLSPPSLTQLKPGDKLLLPSPNGSTLSTLSKAPYTFAACLRNARAVAKAAEKIGGDILIVPAGEQWPDGTMRVALEDHLGAGAVISQLDGDKSAEALAAQQLFLSITNLKIALEDCGSGKELKKLGFFEDVAFAAQLDVSKTMPLLRSGSFINSSPNSRISSIL